MSKNVQFDSHVFMILHSTKCFNLALDTNDIPHLRDIHIP